MAKAKEVFDHFYKGDNLSRQVFTLPVGKAHLIKVLVWKMYD